MSEMERNKGKLVPTGTDIEHYTDENYDDLEDNSFVLLDGEVYEVVWDVKRDTECFDFSDVKVNEDGSIDFHTYHYNSRGHWTELVEASLNNL